MPPLLSLLCLTHNAQISSLSGITSQSMFQSDQINLKISRNVSKILNFVAQTKSELIDDNVETTTNCNNNEDNDRLGGYEIKRIAAKQFFMRELKMFQLFSSFITPQILYLKQPAQYASE